MIAMTILTNHTKVIMTEMMMVMVAMTILTNQTEATMTVAEKRERCGS